MKRLWRVPVLLTIVISCMLSCGPSKTQRNKVDAEKSTSANIENALNYLAKNLDQATFSPVREGWQHDYGFKDGWILNKFEYMRSLLTYKGFQAMFDYPIYLSGPHTGDELTLDSKYSFGHYNPKFVTQLRKSALSLLSDKEFVTMTKPLLEKYSILDFLKKHKSIYEITQEYPDEFIKIKLNFSKGIKDETWSEGSYRSMIPPLLDSDEYWNWSETSYHFWVRRDIDNTKDIWIGLITDVLHAYGS